MRLHIPKKPEPVVTIWTSWFAWYPVKTECDTWVWLENVEVRVTRQHYRGGSDKFFHYRLLEWHQ